MQTCEHLNGNMYKPYPKVVGKTVPDSIQETWGFHGMLPAVRTGIVSNSLVTRAPQFLIDVHVCVRVHAELPR